MTDWITEQAAKMTDGVQAPSEVWRERANQHWDSLTKPLGSLGRLETLGSQIIAIRGENYQKPLSKVAFVFAADHGITAEGVSAYPKEVTYQMVLNFLNKGAAINVLARLHNVQLRVVDVGVDADFELETGGRSELIHHKIARGTANMLLEPAMTEEQVSLALDLGAQLAKDAADAGHNIVAIGEMGIGNTTAASAITCALCGVSATVATGRGTGVSPESYARKIEVVSAVIAKHFDGGNPHPLEILRKVGGLEIAAMTGVVLSAARHKLVVVADGFISTTAAALAVAIEPKARGYIVVGHRSEEPGHKLLLDYLDATPVLAMNMRLGEGTGAVLAMPILESAMCLYSQMATFASAGVSEAS